jgi:hypothetical protein
METIQYQVLYKIAGAFQTTSRAALEICFHVPAPTVTLARMAEEACVRFMTSPLWGILHTVRQSSIEASRIPPSIPSAPSRNHTRGEAWLAAEYRDDPSIRVAPVLGDPDTSIEDTRAKALQAHKEALRRPNGIVAYTDGSATDGGVGAAVVSNLGTRRFQIGTPDTHNLCC